MKKLLFITLLLQLMACDSSMKFIKIADKLALDGNYSEAVNNYYNALLLNAKNKNAIPGIQKNAQLVLDSKFSLFAKYVVEGNNDKALRQYNYCKDYFNKLKNIGVDLNWQTPFDALYEETKQEFISKQYEIGLSQMNENNFDKAEFTFAKIVEFDSTYKDVSVLRMPTILAPLYKQGISYIDAENYKAAYAVFVQISYFDASYKNCLQLLDLCLQKCILPMAIILSNTNQFSNNEDINCYEILVTKLAQSKNPFLKIIDKNNINKLLKEQVLNTNGIVDAETAAKVGKLIGAKYFLLLNVNEVKFDELIPITTDETAYQSLSERVVDPNGEAQSVIKFKKVNYAETKKYRKVETKVSYQLISVQSGQIIAEEVFSSEKADAHSFARFNGNIDNLYPSLPAGNFMPNVPAEWKEKFFELNRELVSSKTLADKTYEEISSKIIDDINLYIEQ